MPDGSEAIPSRPAATPARPGKLICGIAGVIILALVSLVLLKALATAVLFHDFVFFPVLLVGLGLVWLLTQRSVQAAWARILLRAVVVALCFWPFLPYQSVEWSSAWPPASFWVFPCLVKGRADFTARDGFIGFEVGWILFGVVLMWAGGLAIHHYRHREPSPSAM